MKLMADIDSIVSIVIQEIQRMTGDCNGCDIPVGISNRHVHLSQKHLDALFGENTGLTKIKDLSQPGQYACKECVTLIGPKGCIENVRVLGPVRSQTQVEILAADCYKLGVKAPVRESGKLNGTPGIIVCGPRNCVKLEEGLIVAKRHIHMTPGDAAYFGCHDNQIVKVQISGERGGIFDNVVVRVTETSRLDFHIDTEEANCMGIKDNDKVKIVK